MTQLSLQAIEEYVDFSFETADGRYRLQLCKAFYLSLTSINLVSAFEAAASMYSSKFEAIDCTIYEVGTDSVVLILKRTGRLNKENATSEESQKKNMHVVDDNTEAHNSMLYHRHLGHLSFGGTQPGVLHDC